MPKNNNTAIKMTAVAGAWKKAKDRDPLRTFENLEAGVYVMALTACVLDYYGPKKRLGIRWEYTVQEGDSAGCVQSDFSYLDGEDDVYFTQVRLGSMNCEIPDNPDDLPELLQQLATDKPILRCKVVEKDGFVHVYANKLIDEAGGETRDEILGTAKAGVNSAAAPATGTKKVVGKKEEPKPETSAQATTKRVRRGATAEGDSAPEFVEGDRVQFVENGETLKGTFVEMCKEAGFVAVKIDDINEVWEISIEDNEVKKEEAAPAAAAKKTVRKAVVKKELPTELAVGVKVSFNDGEEDQEGEITKMNKKAETCDVQVGEDVFEVPNDACTIIG